MENILRVKRKGLVSKINAAAGDVWQLTTSSDLKDPAHANAGMRQILAHFLSHRHFVDGARFRECPMEMVCASCPSFPINKIIKPWGRNVVRSFDFIAGSVSIATTTSRSRNASTSSLIMANWSGTVVTVGICKKLPVHGFAIHMRRYRCCVTSRNIVSASLAATWVAQKAANKMDVTNFMAAPFLKDRGADTNARGTQFLCLIISAERDVSTPRKGERYDAR